MKTSFIVKLKFLRMHFARTPHDPVYPRRMSQSVLESLFGEIRSFSRGSVCLNSAQFMQRRSVIILKQQTAIVNKMAHVPRPGSLMFLTRRKVDHSRAAANAAMDNCFT